MRTRSDLNVPVIWFVMGLGAGLLRRIQVLPRAAREVNKTRFVDDGAVGPVRLWLRFRWFARANVRGNSVFDPNEVAMWALAFVGGVTARFHIAGILDLTGSSVKAVI